MRAPKAGLTEGQPCEDKPFSFLARNAKALLVAGMDFFDSATLQRAYAPLPFLSLSSPTAMMITTPMMISWTYVGQPI